MIVSVSGYQCKTSLEYYRSNGDNDQLSIGGFCDETFGDPFWCRLADARAS